MRENSEPQASLANASTSKNAQPASGNSPIFIADPRAVLNSIGEVVYDWDISSDVLRWGPNLAEVMGPEAARQLSSGARFGQFLATDSPRSRYEAMMMAARQDVGEGVSFQTQYGLVFPASEQENRDEQRLWLEDNGRVFCGPDLRPTHVHGVVRVIPPQHQSERDMRPAYIFDRLTGALERKPFIERVARSFQDRTSKRATFALLLISIPNLENINKVFGFDVGDDLIAGVANRLRSNLRNNDSLGRYSGSCLALLLDSCDGERLMQASQRLIDSISSEDFATAAGQMRATIRIGACLAPHAARTPRILFQQAETALDLAIHAIDDIPVIYDAAKIVDDKRARNARIADDIVAALNERRVVLAMQPIVHSSTGQPYLYEALMRLRDSSGNIISPGHVLPIAEEAGLISHIDHRVLELSLAQLSANPKMRVAINASSITLADKSWPRHLAAALAMHPGTAARLMVEITETSAIEDVNATCAVVKSMKDLGIKVAMDDFGAGHTSFRNLRKLNVDLLKIDGAFMPNLLTSSDDRYFVRTMINLAHHLDIPVVAEWVEKVETARLLTEWGADYLQGHLFGQAELAPELTPARQEDRAARSA